MAPAKKTRKERVKVDPNETKEQKFIRLTRQRMNKILPAIGNLENLARYPHTDAQADKILTALQSAVNSVQRAFTAKSETRKESFEL